MSQDDGLKDIKRAYYRACTSFIRNVSDQRIKASFIITGGLVENKRGIYFVKELL